MRRAATALLIIQALCACAPTGSRIEAAPVSQAADWTPLFNGANLDGWTGGYVTEPVDARPAAALFTVEDGMIHAYAADRAGSPQAAAYIETVGEYSDYRIHLEYRWGENKFPPRMDRVRDAGLLLHVYNTVDSAWPHSVEFQIQEGDTGDVWAISAHASSTIDPRTEFYAPASAGGAPVIVGVANTSSRIRHAQLNSEVPGWNSIEAVVRGDAATYFVNGVVVMRVHDMKKRDRDTANWIELDRGRIALQAEFAEIYYRNIRVRPLTAAERRGPLP